MLDCAFTVGIDIGSDGIDIRDAIDETVSIARKKTVNTFKWVGLRKFNI
jgi:hypothetical protein